jgi:hypothetical protein
MFCLKAVIHIFNIVIIGMLDGSWGSTAFKIQGNIRVGFVRHKYIRIDINLNINSQQLFDTLFIVCFGGNINLPMYYNSFMGHHRFSC